MYDSGANIPRADNQTTTQYRQDPCKELSNSLCVSYMTEIHVLYPVLRDPQAEVDKFIGQPTTTSIQEATVLLIFALGEATSHETQSLVLQETCIDSAFGGTSRPENTGLQPGFGWYSRAAALLGSGMGQCRLEYAQAMILAALYMSRIGRPLASWRWLSNASQIVEMFVQRHVCLAI
tara:strand:+ start:7597 stop:8130 length:534 start_codon:yes stop_codon:yes gene_type:complete